MNQDELLRLAAQKDSLTESARTALQYELYKRHLETNPPSIEQATEVVQEPKPERARASGWARLGIFLCVAFVSAIVAAAVFFKGDSETVKQRTEQLTSVSVTLGLVVWALSGVVAGRWLTVKRTWIAAVSLYSIAFVLMAVFLGKPLSTKVAELDEEQAQLERRFANSATGKTLLQPESFASPQVAATSLAEFEQYADAKERLNERELTLLLKPDDDPAFRVRVAACVEATRLATSTTEELYYFAADPSRQVHVENGVVITSDPDGYNRRIDAVNDAMDKYKLKCTALAESASKAR